MSFMEPILLTNNSSRRAWYAALAFAGIIGCASFSLVLALETLAPAKQVALASATELAQKPPEIIARAAYVQDLTTGAVLYEKNADTQLPLASITKVPLALVAAEFLSPNDVVVVSMDAVLRGEGGLGEGERWRADDLIDYTLVVSSNVGAEALAEAVDEPIRRVFPQAPLGSAAVWRMNVLAEELGLSQTYFVNPSGLDETLTQPGAMGSAKDIARILRYAAFEMPDVFEATRNPSEIGHPLNTDTKEVENTNDALPDIPGLVLGKTGFTDLAGGNLAIIYEAGPSRPVVAVLLGSTKEGRFEDMRALIRAAQERTR